VTLDQAIERLYDLHPGVTPVEEGAPHERPHKPLLILAALDLIDEGKATPDRIPWCQELRDRFTARFLEVRKHNDQNTPENPSNFSFFAFQLFSIYPNTPHWAMDRDIIAPGPDQFQLFSVSDFQLLPFNPFSCRKIRLSIRRLAGWSGDSKN